MGGKRDTVLLSILVVFTDEDVPWYCYACNPDPLRQLKRDCKKFLEGRLAATTDPMPCTSRGSQIHFTSNECQIPVNEGYTPCSLEDGQALRMEAGTSQHTGEATQSKLRRRFEENNEKKQPKRNPIEEPLEVKLASTTGIGDKSGINYNCKSFQPAVKLTDIGKFHSL